MNIKLSTESTDAECVSYKTW